MCNSQISGDIEVRLRDLGTGQESETFKLQRSGRPELVDIEPRYLSVANDARNITAPTVTLRGQRFTPACLCTVEGEALPTQFISDGELLCSLASTRHFDMKNSFVLER